MKRRHVVHVVAKVWPEVILPDRPQKEHIFDVCADHPSAVRVEITVNKADTRYISEVTTICYLCIDRSMSIRHEALKPMPLLYRCDVLPASLFGIAE